MRFTCHSFLYSELKAHERICKVSVMVTVEKSTFLFCESQYIVILFSDFQPPCFMMLQVTTVHTQTHLGQLLHCNINIAMNKKDEYAFEMNGGHLLKIHIYPQAYKIFLVKRIMLSRNFFGISLLEREYRHSQAPSDTCQDSKIERS